MDVCTSLPIPHELRHRPFSISEARATGLTRDQLKGARFPCIFRSVYAEKSLVIDGATRIRAAILAVRKPAAATAHSGLELHGIGARFDENVHLASRDRRPVRILPVLAGLPAAVANESYGDEHEFVVRLDLCDPEWLVAVEYDGRQHG